MCGVKAYAQQFFFVQIQMCTNQCTTVTHANSDMQLQALSVGFSPKNEQLS